MPVRRIGRVRRFAVRSEAGFAALEARRHAEGMQLQRVVGCLERPAPGYGGFGSRLFPVRKRKLKAR